MADTQGTAGPPMYNSPVYDPSANQRGWNDPPSLAFSQKSGNGSTGRRIDPRKRVAHNFNSNSYTQGTSIGFASPLAAQNPPQYSTPNSNLQSNGMPPNNAPHMPHSSSYPVLSTAGNTQSPAYYMPHTTAQSATNQGPYMGNPNLQMNGNRSPIPHQMQSQSPIPNQMHGQTPSPNIGQPLHQFQNSPFIPSQNGHHSTVNGSLTPPVVNHHHSQSLPNLPGAAATPLLAPTQHQGPPPTDGYYARRASSAETSREHSPIRTDLASNSQPIG